MLAPLHTQRHSISIFAALLVGWLLALPASAVPQTAGNVASQTTGLASAELVLDNGPRVRVEFMNDKLLRVRFAPTGTFVDQPTGARVTWQGTTPGVTVQDAPTELTLQTTELRVVLQKAPFRLRIERLDGSVLVEDEPTNGHVFDPDTGWVYALQRAPAGQAYLGMGERGGAVDRRGRRFVMANQDSAGFDDDRDPLYISIPFFYGLEAGRSYGVFVDNASFPFFDFDSGANGIRSMGAVAGELDYFVFDGPSPREVNETYLKLTGAMPLPPLWSVGYHQARYGYDTQQQILNVAQEFRTRDIPLDAIHIDIDHMDNLQMFTWDPIRFPDPTAMNQTLNSIGVRSIVLLEPLLLTSDPKWPFFAGAGFLLRNPNLNFPHVASIWIGEVSYVDFSNPLATFWWSALHTDFLNTGVSGVWNDLNEPAENFMPLDIEHSFNGNPRPHRDARNLYALQHTEMTRNVLEALRPNERPFLFSRSGFSGIQRNAAVWSGDGNSSWQGFRTATTMGQSMSISGLLFHGHDIGGFLGNPSPELYARWIAAAAFTPYFRTHSTNTSEPREPWSYGPIVEEISRQYIKLRQRWMPYVYSAFESASRTGFPIVRPLVFDFPNDPTTLAHSDTHLFGPSVLVAPVLDPGVTTRAVYLPAGSDWVDYWTDTVHPGGTVVNVSAGLGVIPLFVRGGGMIATSYDRDYAEQVLPRDLLIDVYPDGASETVIYEDDGISLDYQQGTSRNTLIQLQASTNELLFLIGGYGNFDPGPRKITLANHNVVRPTAVTRDGTPMAELTPVENATNVEGWFHDAATNRLTIRVDVGLGSAILRAQLP